LKKSIMALEHDVTKIHHNLKRIAREIYYLYEAMSPEESNLSKGLYLPQEFLPFKEFTLASCGHIYHQKCLKKHLVSGEAICPNKKCNKVIETFLSPEHFKGSQDKPTTSIAEDTATKQVDSENPTLIGEEDCSSKTTKVAKETSDQATSPIEGSTLVEQGLNDAQKKRSRKDSEGIKL
ncbi:4622_t:CDS:2, partial [Gigaspora rosea]